MVAPECQNCYIVDTMPLSSRRMRHGSDRKHCASSTAQQPYAWNAKAERDGDRPRVFCLSLGDWLDDEVPIEWLAELLQIIYATPNLDWLLLTKRPQNFESRIHEAKDKCFFGARPMLQGWLDGTPPNNIWLGVSAGADQRAALAIPAKIHFLSCEPMLHALDPMYAPDFDWIIFGGESGRKARACNVEWIRDGVTFCRENGITPFVKQLGAKPYEEAFPTNVTERERINFMSAGWCHISHAEEKFAPHWQKIYRLKDSHGGDPDEWPEDLRVREFPNAKEAR